MVTPTNSKREEEASGGASVCLLLSLASSRYGFSLINDDGGLAKVDSFELIHRLIQAVNGTAETTR